MSKFYIEPEAVKASSKKICEASEEYLSKIAKISAIRDELAKAMKRYPQIDEALEISSRKADKAARRAFGSGEALYKIVETYNTSDEEVTVHEASEWERFVPSGDNGNDGGNGNGNGGGNGGSGSGTGGSGGTGGTGNGNNGQKDDGVRKMDAEYVDPTGKGNGQNPGEGILRGLDDPALRSLIAANPAATGLLAAGAGAGLYDSPFVNEDSGTLVGSPSRSNDVRHGQSYNPSTGQWEDNTQGSSLKDKVMDGDPKVKVLGKTYQGSLLHNGTGAETANGLAGGEAYVDAGKVEAHAELFASGRGVGLGAGASAVALALGASGHLGNDMAGVHGEAGVAVHKAGVEAEAGVGFDQNGNFRAGAKASAEYIGAEASGKVGADILGTDVDVTGSVNVGVGAHADVGFTDGTLKVDVGASLGVGVSVGVEIDISGTIDAVSGWAESALGWLGW